MVGEPDATVQPTPQDNQLMSKHRVLSFKPQLRLERRGQDGQNETEQPDHSASLGDSITSSTQIRFSVHTGIDKAKICSDRRVDADRPRLRAVFGGRKSVFTQPGSKAEVTVLKRHFRYTPKSGRYADRSECPLRARSGPSTTDKLFSIFLSVAG